jgi:proline iminopeptidase
MQAGIKKMTLAIAALVVLALAVVAGVVFWTLMNRPLYQPGMVRSGENLAAPLAPPPQGQDANRWDVEPGIALHHFSVGAGDNVLVVHGGPGKPTIEPWPGLATLADKHRFIYYDQRGCGRSTRPIDKFDASNFVANVKTLDRALGLGAQIADIERIRRLLGNDKLVLIGHSFGGFLAALYAAEFPQHVKALILVAPADVLVMPQQGRGFFGEVEDRVPPSMKAEYTNFLKRYLDYGSIFSKSEAELVALNGEFDRYYLAATQGQGVAMPGARDPQSSGGWMVHAMYLSMGRRHDYRDALKSIVAPVLVIHGAKDLQPESASRGYVDVIAGAKLTVLPNAWHFPFVDQATAFADAIGSFLGGLR